MSILYVRQTNIIFVTSYIVKHWHLRIYIIRGKYHFWSLTCKTDLFSEALRSPTWRCRNPDLEPCLHPQRSRNQKFSIFWEGKLFTNDDVHLVALNLRRFTIITKTLLHSLPQQTLPTMALDNLPKQELIFVTMDWRVIE